MVSTVRAAVQVAPGTIEMREFPRPSIGADDGLLRVEANGICGSDVEIYHGNIQVNPKPFIPGHEPVGIIEEAGEQAAERWGVGPGDRVALEVVVPCRRCADCLTGRYQACPFRTRSHGVTGVDVAPALWGGFAEYLYLSPTAVMHKIDRSLPIEVAAMYNPLGAGVRWAVQLGGIGLGDTLLVQGAGQRGLAALIAAKAAGASQVIVTGLAADAHKLRLARELGADHALVVDGEDGVDVVEAVMDLTGGRGVDVVADITPMAAAPVSDALRAVKHGGCVVLAGLKGGREIPIVTDLIVNRGITVKGAFGVETSAYERAIKIIESGEIPLERLHTHTFGLEEAGLAIDTLAAGSDDSTAIHVSVHPGNG